MLDASNELFVLGNAERELLAKQFSLEVSCKAAFCRKLASNDTTWQPAQNTSMGVPPICMLKQHLMQVSKLLAGDKSGGTRGHGSTECRSRQRCQVG